MSDDLQASWMLHIDFFLRCTEAALVANIRSVRLGREEWAGGGQSPPEGRGEAVFMFVAEEICPTQRAIFGHGQKSPLARSLPHPLHP